MKSLSFPTLKSNQHRNRLLLSAAVALGVLSVGTQAAQITWTGATNGSTTADWQNAGNWNGAVPVNSTNTALFTDTGTYNSSTAATIDANGSFSVGSIQFTTTASGTAPPITVGNSQNGIITLTGATGVLVQNKQTNNVTLNLNLALANAAAGNSTLFTTNQATTVGGIISDGISGSSSSIVKNGSATLQFKGINTYTGTTTVQQNTLQIGADAPSGSAGALGVSTTPVQIGNASTTATQNIGITTTGKFTIGRDISVFAVPSSTGTVTIGGSTSQTGTSTFAGQLALGLSANLQSATTGTGVVDFTGQITGVGGISKTLAGTVQLDNAANTYLGATRVTAGTLLINGAATGGGLVSVTAGTLGGTGKITTGTSSNGLALSNGAVLAPGLAAGGIASSGTSFTVNGDATLDGTLSIQADTDTSKLVTSGFLALNGDSSLVFTGTPNLSAPAYVIATYGLLGGTGSFGTVSNLPAGYALNYAYQGNEIALVATAATPEPGTLALLAFGGIPLLTRRRRGA